MKEPRLIMNIYFEQAEHFISQANSFKLYCASEFSELLKIQSQGKFSPEPLAKSWI